MVYLHISPLFLYTPKGFHKANHHPRWQQAMIVEMKALEHNDTYIRDYSSSFWQESNWLQMSLCH